MKAKKLKNSDRRQCEFFSRIVGYLRPVQNWNDGKVAEFAMRQEYTV